MASEPPRLVGDDDVDAGGGHQDNRIVSQENKVTGDGKKDKAEHRVLCVDDKPQSCGKKDDKWKPVVDGSEKDKLLMPPPGGFLRPSAG